MPMSLGGLLFAACTLLAVVPVRRPRRAGLVTWMVTMAPNELPFLFIAVVLLSWGPELAAAATGAPVDPIGALVAVATVAGLVVVAVRAHTARWAGERALLGELGRRWRQELRPELASGLRRRRPWGRILLTPWPWRPRDVERIADIAYGDDGSSTRLDVYRHRSHPESAPTLVHLHGGRFRYGRKSREARPLLHHLARQGWTCISANYHLSPDPGRSFPEPLVDVKRVIAWSRGEGRRHGIDPDTVFVSGSSAGAHLAVTAALTAGEEWLQPGFEQVDTSVTAAIGFYGYYGRLGGPFDELTSPADHLSPDAPPVLLVHGTNDTFTPIEGARHLAASLRRTSHHPVVLAELPGAQHSFDVFHSLRYEAVIDTVEAFAAWVRSVADPPGRRRPLAPASRPGGS